MLQKSAGVDTREAQTLWAKSQLWLHVLGSLYLASMEKTKFIEVQATVNVRKKAMAAALHPFLGTCPSPLWIRVGGVTVEWVLSKTLQVGQFFLLTLKRKQKLFKWNCVETSISDLERDQVFSQNSFQWGPHPETQTAPWSSTPAPLWKVLASKQQLVLVQTYFIRHVLTKSNLKMPLCHQLVERSALNKKK